MGIGKWTNLRSIKSIFKGFELILGFKVNFFKSKIYGVNLQEDFMCGASYFLCCCRGVLSFKFLGMSVGPNPMRCESWVPIVQSLKQKLSTWKAWFLSIGGRVILLNFVLASIPIYIMSFYKVSVKVVKDIIRI